MSEEIQEQGEFLISVGTLRASNGTSYLVCVSHNDGKVPDLFNADSMYQVRNYTHKYQAMYEAACLDRFLNKRFDIPEPDILTYNARRFPNED